MFDLCYKRHVRSGIAGILLQATDKGIKGEGGGGVQDARRGGGVWLGGLGGFLLQGKGKEKKGGGGGGVQDALRGAGLCLQALRLMFFLATSTS